MEIEISSPAKINLMLAVTGLRDDGFHSLTSLVAPLSFGDTIFIRVKAGKTGISLETSDPILPEDDRNIAWRAADLFLKRFGLDTRVEIRIEKNIPIGAGLGGGSSNAAAVLKGLATLFEIQDGPALRDLAEKLGSDCPLFLNPEPLIMRGRGEEIERLDDAAKQSLAGESLVLFKPAFGISTLWAYQSLARFGEYAEASEAEKRLSAWKKGALSLSELLFNSFDSVVGRKYPSIPLMLESIRQKTGVSCLMSGSGSACFALCNQANEAGIRGLVAEYWGASAFFRSTRIADIGLTRTNGLSF